MKYCLYLTTLLFTGLTFANEKAIEKFILDSYKIKSEKLSPELINKVFTGDFYKVKVIADLGGGGTSTSERLVQVVSGKVSGLQDTTTNMTMTGLNKCLNKGFKLNSEADIKTFEKVLDLLYPINTFGKKEKKIINTKGKVTFVRGKFFKKFKGFVVETDDGGVIKTIKYSLDIK